MPASKSAATSNPAGDSAGAGAVSDVQVPRFPARSQRCRSPVHAVLQHTPSTQSPDPHNDGVLHAPPRGIGVRVGVDVIVGVDVMVGVDVTVPVLLAVAVAVAVAVTVEV